MDVESIALRLLPKIKGKNTVIIGWPASGKSSIALAIEQQFAVTIRTDDFMDESNSNGYERSLYVMLPKVLQLPTPHLIEGMLGYRLLRKGVEQKNYFPDVVVEMVITQRTLETRYEKHRKGKNILSAISWAHMHDGILDKYKRMYNPHKPEWIMVQNDEFAESSVSSLS